MPQPKLPEHLMNFCKEHHNDLIDKLMATTPATDPDADKKLRETCESLINKQEPSEKPVQTEESIKEELQLMYDNTTPLPGMPIQNEAIQDADKSPESLEEAGKRVLIANAAREKLKREKARPLEVRLREFTINSLCNEYARDFFAKHGFVMSGQQKRETKRRVTRAYDKGEIIKTPKQREDLIAAMDSPLNNPETAPAQYTNPMKQQAGGSPVQPGKGILY